MQCTKKLYTTLGPSFYFRNETAVTRRRRVVQQNPGSYKDPHDEIYRFRMSKRDLERSENPKNQKN